MSTDDGFKERPNNFPWPPVILVTTLALGYVLGSLFAFNLPWPPATRTFGGVLIAIALAIDVAAMISLWRAKTTILPHQASDHLVMTGIFAISRNPIYVANVLLIIGFGLRWENFWLFLLAPVAAMATQRLAIVREEAHLRHRFGAAYEDYCARVRRWI
ncbi:MAG: isoprenylcysteine carboxylmethyltransferase family protein [Pseudomonadota bacterium]